MHQVAPLAAPRESIFAVLASSARRMSYGELSIIAAGSGVAALTAVALARASWMLVAVCYVLWCFASWGLLFRSATPRSAGWRAFHWLIVGSGSAVFVTLLVGLFFWALGPRWVL